MPKVSILNRYGIIDSVAAHDQGVQEHYKELVDHQTASYTNLLDGLTRNSKAIRSSTKLTNAGKSDSLLGLGRATLAELDKISQSPPLKLKFDRQQLGIPNFPTTSSLAKERGEDPVVLYLLHRELREKVAAVESPLRRPLMLDAAAADDRDILAACNTHRLLAPISPDLLNETKGAWIDSVSPPSARAITTTEQIYQGNLATAKRLIAKECGLAVDVDPLEEMAGGGANTHSDRGTTPAPPGSGNPFGNFPDATPLPAA